MKATFLHNMKRYLLLFLLPLYAIVDSSAYDFEKDGIYYAIKSADNLEVKVVSKAEFTTSYSGDVTIPESVEHEGNTYRVTEIFINAFSNCRDLTSVVVPGSVTQIGDYAFRNCRRLHSVTLSEGVTQIGDSAFVNCWNLKSVSFSDSVVKIGDYAFRNCSRLSSVVIPDGVGEIGEGLFYNCTGLISVTIPGSVSQIGDYAFFDCDQLFSVMLSEGITQIGDSVFIGCQSLESLNIPGSVTQIDDCTFMNCSQLISVTLSEGVTQIGDSAFVNCQSLESVTIPVSVSQIGDYAFRNCSRLSSVVIPDGVGEIGEGLFYNCTGLISATIPGSVTQIGDYAFLGCLGLTSAALSEGVIQIGDSAFVNCQNLGSVIIPSSVTSIGKYAFRSCRGLSSAIIPEGVNEIEEGLFYYCKELTEITLPGGIAKIGDKAFYECSHLLAVEFPSKIKEIGVSAFDGCSGLTAVSIPDSITYISRSAFNNCVRLSSVTVSENVKEIGRYAFDNTLWYSNQPEGAVYINDILYKYKGVLPIDSEIVIKEGTTTISDIAFMEQTGLRSVIFPESMARMGGEIFNGCSGLSEIECKAAVPPVCDENCFLGISRSKCKLYVPMNAMTSYRDSLGWNGFRIFANNMFDRDPVWEYIETTAGKRDNLTVTHRYRVENPVVIDGKIYYNLVYENNASGTFGQNVDVILKKIREEDGRILVDYEEYKRYCDREHIDYIPYKVTDGELVLYDFNMKVGDRYEHVDGYEDIWISEIRRIRTKDGKLRKLFILNNGVEFMEGIGCLSACKQPLLNYLNPVNDDISISLASFSDTGGLVYWQSDVENFCFEVGGVYYRYSETVRSGVSVTYKRGYPEYSGDVTIPETVKYGGQTYRVVAIDEFAFKNCEYMTSVSLPEGLIAIGDNSFHNCIRLSSVIIPDGVSEIGEGLFYNCTDLNEVTLSGNVARIGDYAFYECWHLSSLTIPGSVSSIGQEAFSGCTGLTEITCKAAVPPICEADCFLGVEQRDCKLYVAEGSVEAYRNAPVWQNFDIIATDFSGIEGISAEGSVRIYASGGSIVLENLSPGMPVAVYDTTGRKVKTVEATGSRMEVALPAGFYVVECAGKVERVMLRALSGRI